MDTTITLDETHYRIIADKARDVGQTPEEFLRTLIDAQSSTFDEILAPMRKGFEAMSDEAIESLFDRARDAARRTN